MGGGERSGAHLGVRVVSLFLDWGGGVESGGGTERVNEGGGSVSVARAESLQVD